MDSSPRPYPLAPPPGGQAADEQADPALANRGTGVVVSYFAAREAQLLETARVLRNTGHRIHSGTAREVFLRDFLLSHLSERVGAGTGEIINADSAVGDQRNQLDIIVYDREYPRLSFGGDVRAYFAESVIAVIEVKSSLDETGLRQAMRAALNLKALSRHFTPLRTLRYRELMQLGTRPKLRYYVVAFHGPANMATVLRKLRKLDGELGVAYPAWGPTAFSRASVDSPTVDGVYVLGKGYMQFDNHPLHYVTDQDRTENPDARCEIVQSPGVGLHHLFMVLTMEGQVHSFWTLNAGAYGIRGRVDEDQVRFGF